MAELTEEDRKNLLRLARSVIENALDHSEKVRRPRNPGPALTQKRGGFVTLHKRGALRGCIGSIEPESPLVQTIEENALNSAFKDPRFPSLNKSELDDVDIEVSVLTVPQDLAYKDAEDLKKKLRPGVDGVILSGGWRRATFLPQVWKQLPDVESFLSHLCMKAGMDAEAWKKGDVKVQTYQAEFFSEDG